jgi:hypothetical protein
MASIQTRTTKAGETTHRAGYMHDKATAVAVGCAGPAASRRPRLHRDEVLV